MTLAIVARQFDRPSQTFVRDHVTGLAPGDTVRVGLAAGPSAPDPGPPLLAGLAAPRTPFGRILNALAGPPRRLSRRSGLRLREFLAAHDVDVLLVEFLHVAVPVLDALRGTGLRCFVHVHGFEVYRLGRDPRWRRHYLRVFERVDGVIAASAFMAAAVIELGCPAEKVHVAPLGVDSGAFGVTTREPGRIVAVGRLVEKKAPQHTLEAFARVHARRPEARLDLVGDGPLRARCERLVAALGLGEAVVLHGACDSAAVRALLGRASLFVQHSVTAANGDREGFGVSIVEAMSCALPVVTTRHNGFVETVVEGETGLLVDEHDVDGMAGAMIALLEDPLRAEALGRAGRDRACRLYDLAIASARLGRILGLPARETSA